jgi:hypothetical protein
VEPGVRFVGTQSRMVKSKEYILISINEYQGGLKMTTKEELNELLSDKTASIYARLIAIKKLYPEQYSEFNLEVDINSRNDIGITALMRACSYNHIDIVKLLIEAGADINAKDKVGYTALIVASANGRIEIVKLLIKAGSDVNAKEKWEYTALMYASENGYTDIVKLLIEAGADVNAKDKRGVTALAIAKSKLRVAKSVDYTKIINLLLEAGAK